MLPSIVGLSYCPYVFSIVPTAPTSLMVVDVGDTTVTLSWMPPDPPNGIITDYRVRYRERGSNGGFMGQDLMNTSLTSTVTNLMMGTEYEFQIRAFTVVGVGDRSVFVFARPGKLQ